MKNKSIPIDKFISIIKEEYIYLRVIPHKSIRNYNSSNVARSVALSYKSLTKLIKIENKKIFIKNNFKVSYLIEIRNNQVNFYFIIPKVFKNVLLEKLTEIWSKATIEEVEPIEPISSSSLNYQVYYEKEDALSIDINKKTNDPLNTMLNVMDIMQDSDRILVGYNLNPTSQMGWDLKYEETVNNFKNGKPIDKDKSSKSYILRCIGSGMIGVIEAIFETINDFIPSGNDIKKNSLMNTLRVAFEEKMDLSLETKKKKDSIVLDGEILISSQSDDDTRRYNNVKSVTDSYQVLDGDNKLISKELKTIPILEKKNWGCIMNKFSADECQNFIQIAGYELLKRFKIGHVNTEERIIPELLQDGTKCLGISTYKGTKTQGYLDNEWNTGNLPLLLLASQGSGKSTYMTNYVNYCSKANESAIVVDFIKNCELSSSIEKVVDKSKLIVLDLSKEQDLQSFCFNEIVITENTSKFDRLRLASLASQQTISLVDSINDCDPLSPRMRRYLNASCMICYVLGHNTLRDVINCLENPNMREYYKDQLGEMVDDLADEIAVLDSLSEYTKPTKKDPTPELVGNKDSKIEYIMDRICLLSEDFKMKYMFNKSSDNNINFVDIMNQGKILLIKMKESEYPTKSHKNILTTFFMSKIWLACQLRGSVQDKPLRANIVCDELFQAPTALNMLTYVLPQSRKFGCKLILSSQYLSQLKGLHVVLEACGASVMLMKGVSESDWKFYSSKIEGFEYEDICDMPAYHSINLVYTHIGKFYSFLTQLPKPVCS